MWDKYLANRALLLSEENRERVFRAFWWCLGAVKHTIPELPEQTNGFGESLSLGRELAAVAPLGKRLWSISAAEKWGFASYLLLQGLKHQLFLDFTRKPS